MAATETSSAEATRAKKTLAPSSQQPPPPGAGGEEGNGGGVDRISGLPDAILGDIITLLPTKDAARTQTLAHRWRHVWRAAPLNLNCRRRRGGGLPGGDDEALAGVVSEILSAHHGPGRVFCVPAHYLHDRAAAVDAWLLSPALDNLHEIELCYPRRRPPLDHPPPAPASMFRFSATLRSATFAQCQIPDEQTILFLPQLRQLALVRVRICEDSLQSMISRSSCPALERLFLDSSHGFRRVRINSTRLQIIYVRTDYYGPDLHFVELVVEDAPCLEKLLCAERIGFRVSVVAAPKLQTLGSLCNWLSSFSSSRHVFGYRGTKSHVRFASFFLLNAKELEVMRLEVEEKNCNGEFFAEQCLKLQGEGWAPGGARVDFALSRCKCRIIHINHIRDLAVADPFECTC